VTRANSFDDLLAEVFLASAAPAEAPELRARVLASVATTTRFRPELIYGVARLLGVDEAYASAVLASIDDPVGWHGSFVPGVQVKEVGGGAASENALTWLVRVATGGKYLEHRHVGQERGLVLQGRLQDNAGRLYRVGDFLEMDAGSSHELHVKSRESAITLIVAHGGLAFGELLIPPKYKLRSKKIG
jgi:hypothetical protein